MKVLKINGYSNSGKTTVAENLITELKRRCYRVGSVKEISCTDFKMDTEGTDTDRHVKAGSEMVTARGIFETDMLFPGRLPIEKVLCFYNQDYCILEGVGDIDVPKIITAHSRVEIDDLIDSHTIAISGSIANDISEYEGLPVINCLTDIAALADLVENKVSASMIDAEAHCRGSMGLYIEGRRVEMTPNVQRTLHDAILGIIKNIGGYAQGKSIELFMGTQG